MRLIPKVIYRLIISSAYRITVYMILPISAFLAEHCDSLPYSDRRPYFRTLCKSSLPHMGKELPFIFFFSVRQSGRMTLGVVGGGGGGDLHKTEASKAGRRGKNNQMNVVSAKGLTVFVAERCHAQATYTANIGGWQSAGMLYQIRPPDHQG